MTTYRHLAAVTDYGDLEMDSYPLHVRFLKFILVSIEETIQFYSILFYPITLGGRRGTTDEFATIPFHLDLFSAG